MKPTYDVPIVLDELKVLHNMTLTEIGEKLGVTGGAVSLWYNGKGINRKNHDALWDLYTPLNKRWHDTMPKRKPTKPIKLTGFGEKLQEAIADNAQAEPVAVPDKVSKPTTTGAIQAALTAAEKFRATHGLTWVIKEDGSLGAKRVITEEF